jgi:hypothetical protein
MRIATGPKAERAVTKVLLVNRLQQQGNRPLRHLFLERRDAERTLAAIRLVASFSIDARIVAGSAGRNESPRPSQNAWKIAPSAFWACRQDSRIFGHSG